MSFVSAPNPAASNRSAALIAAAAATLLGLSVAQLVAAPAVVLPAAAFQNLEAGPLGEPATEWMLTQRAGQDGAIAPDAYAAARDEAMALRAKTAQINPELAGAEWGWMGPRNVGGRILDIALDNDDQDTVYVATAGGGVWHSTDAGVTLNPRWDDALPQSVGAIAMNEDGVLLAGTGEAPQGGGSVTYGGEGIFRSTDDGATWALSGLEDAGSVSELVFHPTDKDTVYAAVSGDNFVFGGDRGLYRSVDAGLSWELILAPANDRSGASDIAIDPSDAEHMLVTMWEHWRVPTKRVYGGLGSGVFETFDGGATWTQKTALKGVTADKTGRIAIAFAPSDPDRLYAVVVDHIGYAAGFFRSDDNAATWTRVSGGPSNQSSYGWWFGRLWVDPADPDRVLIAGVDLIESPNAGGTFIPHSNVTATVVLGVNYVNPHADHHAMVWDERVPGRVYLGNDGGLYRSDSNAAPAEWIGALSQGFTQHYSVGVSQQRPARVTTGMQDNSCFRNWDPAGEAISMAGLDSGTNDLAPWVKYGLCGDGLHTSIHPGDDRFAFSCAQYAGNCSRTEDGGAGFRFISPNAGSAYNWFTPFVHDMSDPSIMYSGGTRVSRSTNDGLNFSAISDELTGFSDYIQQDSNYKYRTITTIAANEGTLVVGTDNGWLWRSTNNGLDFVRIDQEHLPADEQVLPAGRWVTRVAMAPGDNDTIFVTYSGYRGGEAGAHVAKSTDGGATWADISGDLPDAPVNDIVVAGDDLIVATDVGVFLTTDGGATWLAVGQGLPVIPVMDIEFHAGTGTVSAATFGRGIMRVSLS